MSVTIRGEGLCRQWGCLQRARTTTLPCKRAAPSRYFAFLFENTSLMRQRRKQSRTPVYTTTFSVYFSVFSFIGWGMHLAFFVLQLSCRIRAFQPTPPCQPNRLRFAKPYSAIITIRRLEISSPFTDCSGDHRSIRTRLAARKFCWHCRLIHEIKTYCTRKIGARITKAIRGK